MPQKIMRESEYASVGVKARWLDGKHAKNAYQFALRFSSRKRYGLNEETVHNIERLVIESYPVAQAWLGARLSPEGTLQVVYGPEEVCVVGASDFIASWSELLLPSRDDAVVLHNLNRSVVFYCHEEELEFGERKA